MKRKVLFGILPIVLMCACGAPKVTESVLPETSVSETSADDAILSEEISEEVSPSTEDDSKEKLIPLHSATVEALEASKVYTYQDLYSDEVDSDLTEYLLFSLSYIRVSRPYDLIYHRH